MSQRTLELILKARNETQQALGQMQRDMKGVASTSQHLQSVLGGIGVGLGVGGLAAALVNTAKRAIEAGSRLHDLGMRVGVGAGKLAEYEYAAVQMGGSLDSVVTAIRFMQRNMSEATDKTSEIARAFKALNIDVTELRKLKPDEAFDAVVKAIGALGSQYDQTAAAQMIFGRGSAEILALLRDGGDELRRMQAEYRKLGFVMTDEMAARLDAAGDSVQRLQTTWQTFATSFVSEIAPEIERAALGLLNILSPDFRERIKSETAAAIREANPLAGEAWVQRQVNTTTKRLAASYDYYVAGGGFPGPMRHPSTYRTDRTTGAFDTSSAAAGSGARIPTAGDDMAYLPGRHEYIMNQLMAGEVSASDFRVDVHSIIESEQATAKLAENSERARAAWELIESYGGETLATFTAMTDVAGALAGVGEAFGGQNERWVQGLRKVQQIYQSIYALVQAIRAMQTVFTAIGLQDGGAVPMAAGGAVRAARGYMIPDGQRGMDSRLILGQPGEVVIDRHTVQELQDFLGRARSASVSGFGLLSPRGRGGATVQFVNQFPMSRSEAMELGRRAAVATAEYERRFL